jgi:hypothetical protein
MHRFTRRPSPAMAVAFIALLAALSGTAVALPGKNTVDSGDIRKGAVKRGDIGGNAVNGGKVANNSIGGADVRNDGLTGDDVNESSLGAVPNATNANSANTANSANSANTANTATNAGNADQLDGQDSTEFASVDDPGIALAGANVSSGGTLNAWFNNFGGEPTVTKGGTGSYTITFPGLEGVLFNSQAIHMATLLDGGEIRASSSGGNPLVFTFTSAGAAADRSFYYTVFGSNLTP